MRSLAPGQPILMTDLEPQSAIRRGDIVALVFAKGNVRLSVQGEALSAGGLGDTIPVRNLQSRKQVFGVVRDSATIVVK
jgi:flagella basal body P-ring formation protein FlgA